MGSRGRRIVMAAMSARGSDSRNHSSIEEGRDGSFSEEDIEVIRNRDKDVILERGRGKESQKEIICCRELCINCSPCQLRVNLVGLFLLFIFSVGAGLGAINRSPTATDPTASKNGSDIRKTPPASGDRLNFGEDDDDFNNSNKNDNDKDIDTDTDTDDFSIDSHYLVGVYYYPWHGSNFHNGQGYIRKDLKPEQGPLLGEYDDSKPETISKHLKWSQQANIGLWVTSWWGPNLLEDINTRNVIMDHKDLGDLKIALHYESAGRIKNQDTSNVASDIQYMCKHYFSHPNYYKIDGRPVLVVYITRYFQDLGILEEVLTLMRNSANSCGNDLYIIGDHVFGDSPDLTKPDNRFLMLDAVTNYDVYGSMGRPIKYAGAKAVDDYYREQEKWRSLAIMNGCRYIPATSPGYNDRGVRLQNDHPPLSRKLTVTAEEGSLFKYQLEKALPLVDPLVDNLVLVNSFNEWHEDTQIEPAGPIESVASLPVILTGGLQYEGYGELYLDILRDSTISKLEN